jgi:hypothetical protein
VVEAQRRVSTRKLVDTLDEQAVLEQLIETSKPAVPSRSRGASAAVGSRHPLPSHVLLSTPFRYPPLRHGSRFGGRFERGIWYGAESQRALFAEAAYYRLVFLAGTAADLGIVTSWHTAFAAAAEADRAIDLTAGPFEAHRAAIASPVSYDASQALGAAMRSAGVALCRYPSARDAQGGTGVAVFDPAVFDRIIPRDLETWHSAATRARVEFVRRDWFDPLAFAFPRDEFLVDGVLPAPAV